MKKMTFGGTVLIFLVAFMFFTMLGSCVPEAELPTVESPTAEPSPSPVMASPEIKIIKIRLGLANWTSLEIEAFGELVELFHQSEYSVSEGKVFFVEYDINDALSRDPPHYEATIKLEVDLLYMNSTAMDKVAKNTGRTRGDEVFLSIDTSRITTYDNLYITEPYQTTGFMLPLFAHGQVLAYRSDLVADPPESMQQLLEWVRLNPGKFTMRSPLLNSRVLKAMVYQFLPEEAKTSSDPKWATEWEQSWSFLTDFNQYLYTRDGEVYYSDQIEETFELLTNGEIFMITDYLDTVILSRKKGLLPESVKVSMLPGQFEGGTAGIYITADGRVAEEKDVAEGAYAFLSFLLTPEAQEVWADKMGCAPVIDLELMSAETRETYAAIDPRKFAIYDLGDLSRAFSEKIVWRFADWCENMTPVS